MKDLTLRYIATCLQEASLLKSPLSSQENTWTLHDASRRISHCLIDSRKLHSPQDTLFFALRTASNDGHKFVSELYQRGVRAFVVMEKPATWASFDQADFLVVEDTLQALQALSAGVRKACQAPLLAIAGSNGKTIVKEWIWQLLRQEVQITRSPGSFNSQIGVPLSLLELDDETQLAIIEAGISRQGEMVKLARIIR
ncbi:MAG: hypothetical protein J6Q26_02935, partial [Bacteroidales bacterium]|nr:hypothetical protein [Bacteroidales bacterium]